MVSSSSERVVKNVLILGHSYVRDLSLSPELFEYNVKFVGIPGATFATFLNDPSTFNCWVENGLLITPDCIVVLLGGNDLSYYDNKIILDNAFTLFRCLRDTFSTAKLIVSQIENRFYSMNNRFIDPLEYKLRSAALNKEFNRRKGDLFCLLLVRGKSNLDNPNLFRSDGVHLNHAGKVKLSTRINDLVNRLFNSQ